MGPKLLNWEAQALRGVRWSRAGKRGCSTLGDRVPGARTCGKLSGDRGLGEPSTDPLRITPYEHPNSCWHLHSQQQGNAATPSEHQCSPWAIVPSVLKALFEVTYLVKPRGHPVPTSGPCDIVCAWRTLRIDSRGVPTPRASHQGGEPRSRMTKARPL